MKSKELYNSLFKKYDTLTLTDAIGQLSELQIELTKYIKRSIFIKDPIQLDIDDITPSKDIEEKAFYAYDEMISYKDREHLKEVLVNTEIALDQIKTYFGFNGENYWRLKEKTKKKKENAIKN